MIEKIRIGAPLMQWLYDSDAGDALRHGKAIPHGEQLSAVLRRAWEAPRRPDGSVLIEIKRTELDDLGDWVDHIAFVSIQDSGHDATERGRLNSARAAQRAIAAIESSEPPIEVIKNQRWTCVMGMRAGVDIRIVGNVGLPVGRWLYENLSASRRGQYGEISVVALARKWTMTHCHHEREIDDCGQCFDPNTLEPKPVQS